MSRTVVQRLVAPPGIGVPTQGLDVASAVNVPVDQHGQSINVLTAVAGRGSDVGRVMQVVVETIRNRDRGLLDLGRHEVLDLRSTSVLKQGQPVNRDGDRVLRPRSVAHAHPVLRVVLQNVVTAVRIHRVVEPVQQVDLKALAAVSSRADLPVLLQFVKKRVRRAHTVLNHLLVGDLLHSVRQQPIHIDRSCTTQIIRRHRPHLPFKAAASPSSRP